MKRRVLLCLTAILFALTALLGETAGMRFVHAEETGNPAHRMPLMGNERTDAGKYEFADSDGNK